MGMLTREEKDALEDVFMSIYSRKSMFNSFKQHLQILIKTIKHSRLGTKINEFHNFIEIFQKKKKNLSK